VNATPEQSHNADGRPVLLPTGTRKSTKKRRMALTGQERQVLLTELAEIAAELDALQERTAELAARVAPRSPVRLARPA